MTILSDMSRNQRAVDMFQLKTSTSFKKLLHETVKVDNNVLFKFVRAELSTVLNKKPKDIFKLYQVDKGTQDVYLFYTYINHTRVVKAPFSSKQTISELNHDYGHTLEELYVLIINKVNTDKDRWNQSVWFANRKIMTLPLPIRIKSTKKYIHHTKNSIQAPIVYTNHLWYGITLDKSGYNVSAYRNRLYTKAVFLDNSMKKSLERVEKLQALVKRVIAEIPLYSDNNFSIGRNLHTWNIQDLAVILKNIASITDTMGDYTLSYSIADYRRKFKSKVTRVISNAKNLVRTVIKRNAYYTEELTSVFNEILEV